MPEVDVEGQHIYYNIVGNGPHVVFLMPGFLGTIESDFLPIFPLLNKTKFRWICWDPPGYGRSRPEDLEVGQEMYERSGILGGKFMKKLGFDKFSVLGWSQGGTFGLMLAKNFPETVNKLVFWGTFAFLTKRAHVFHKASANLDLWPKEKLEEKLKSFERDYLQKQCTDMVVFLENALKQEGLKVSRRVAAHLESSTLILHGKKDRILDEEQPLTWKSLIKNSRIYYFPEGGHDLHLTHAAEFVEVVENFLQQ